MNESIKASILNDYLCLSIYYLSLLDQASTLFRANSMASKMLYAYASVVGREYLTLVVQPTMQKIIKQNIDLEVMQT